MELAAEPSGGNMGERDRSTENELSISNSSPASRAKRMDRAGLRAAKNILQRWGLCEVEISRLLALSKARQPELHTGIDHLTEDHRDQISYILSIHASLRVMFRNPDNVYGFMQYANHNPPFDGRSPLSFLLAEPPDFELVIKGLDFALFKLGA